MNYKKYMCSLCSYIYNEETGDNNENISPHTKWDDIPDTWTCPECGASKDLFHLISF
jgi:rubredoxin